MNFLSFLMRLPRLTRAPVAAALALGLAAIAPVARADASTSAAWEEHFDRAGFRWDDPFEHGAAQLARVYSVQHEGTLSFLHAHHDGGGSSPPKAMHYGRAFQKDPPALDKVAALTWKWRARRHPLVTDDAWEDMAGGVYVIVKTPSLLRGGKGFKFGWLAKPGERGTHQHGLLQVELRHEPATTEWKTERVDLCALYKKEYDEGCEGQHVLYVGVVTDGDNTDSVAEADYADFALVSR